MPPKVTTACWERVTHVDTFRDKPEDSSQGLIFYRVMFSLQWPPDAEDLGFFPNLNVLGLKIHGVVRANNWGMNFGCVITFVSPES